MRAAISITAPSNAGIIACQSLRFDALSKRFCSDAFSITAITKTIAVSAPYTETATVEYLANTVGARRENGTKTAASASPAAAKVSERLSLSPSLAASAILSTPAITEGERGARHTQPSASRTNSYGKALVKFTAG